MELTGIHHVTAISAAIRENYRFYVGGLGMRLVKRSVNQDEVSAYHLFYADAKGSPGTDLTFFGWPLRPERRGTRAITRTYLRVAGLASLEWWTGRLRELGMRSSQVTERDGRLTLDFEDPEGQRLALVDDGGTGPAYPWDRSPVPSDYQIRGLGPIVLSVPSIGPTDALLTRVLGLRPMREYPNPADSRGVVHVYEMGPGGLGAELHVAVEPDRPAARQGAGGVHHVALRTPTYEELAAWVERVTAGGVANSGLVERYYFRSLYFREPNGILFEIASDGPGFAVDEDQTTLGQRLALPPFLESRRAEIEAGLTPIE